MAPKRKTPPTAGDTATTAAAAAAAAVAVAGPSPAAAAVSVAVAAGSPGGGATACAVASAATADVTVGPAADVATAGTPSKRGRGGRSPKLARAASTSSTLSAASKLDDADVDDGDDPVEVVTPAPASGGAAGSAGGASASASSTKRGAKTPTTPGGSKDDGRPKCLKGLPDWTVLGPSPNFASLSLDERLAAVAPCPQYFKVVVWNVCGLRAMLKSNEKLLKAYVEREAPDVLAFNETKIDDSLTQEMAALFPGYTGVFNCSVKKGYSGVAVFHKSKDAKFAHGISIAQHDEEGRVLTMEFPKAYVVVVYVPNAGAGLARLDYRTKEWDPAFREYLNRLKATKSVIVVGDMNVCHEEVDIHDPKGNRNKSAGFTDAEREQFTKLLDSGFVDSWRHLYPTVCQFSYWSYRFGPTMRTTNKGWRLDYALVSKDLTSSIKEAFVRSDVGASDHGPVGVCLDRSAII